METQFKSIQQELADTETCCRIIRLIASLSLATASFMGLVFLPIWIVQTKSYMHYIPEFVVMIISGLLVTQILVLGCYREIKHDSRKYQI